MLHKQVEISLKVSKCLKIKTIESLLCFIVGIYFIEFPANIKKKAAHLSDLLGIDKINLTAKEWSSDNSKTRYHI